MNDKGHLNSIQEQKLRELGSYLHEIRTKRSWSLELIASKTRIQIRQLRAIEEAKCGELPEPIYVRGLIERFANALDLDGADFASAFPTSRQVVNKSQPLRIYLPIPQFRPVHMYMVYIFVLVSAVSGLSVLVNKQSPQEATETNKINVGKVESPQPKNSPNAKLVGATNSASSEQKTGASNLPVNNQGETVIVAMTAQENCWLQVKIDGKKAYEGTLSKGEQRTWQGKEIFVRAGNAGGVVVAINNQEAKPLGSPGTIQTAVYRKPHQNNPS